jgi:hypothetical protein
MAVTNRTAGAPALTEAEALKKAKSDAYGAATSRLKDAHRAELNGYIAEEMAARHIDWRPRPTASEKATAEIKRLIEEHPDLVGNPDLRAALGL